MLKSDAGQAVIARVVDDELAYAVTRGAKARSVAFGPQIVKGFAGESLSELGLVEGSAVIIDFDAAGIATGVDRPSMGKPRGGSTTKEGPIPRNAANGGTPSAQLELIPTEASVRETKISRAVPVATRKFGKLIDTARLRPGDLMLSRDINQEWTGRAIVAVQEKGGYDKIDAQWTHVAMYLGDGEHVVEATFDSPMKGGDVRLTNLDSYCIGESVVRFRRSKFLTSDEVRWKLCIRALSRLKKPYSFAKAIEMWSNVVLRGIGFYDDNEKYQVSDAVICSTLYADAYSDAVRRTLGEVCGACTPAWLSASDEFDDVKTHWLRF